MNKNAKTKKKGILFTLLATLSVGVGVVSANQKSFLKTKAEGGTATIQKANSNTYTTAIADDHQFVYGTSNNHLSITNSGGATIDTYYMAASGGTNTVLNNGSGEIRLYPRSGVGGGLKFVISSGYKFTAATFTLGTNSGASINGGSAEMTTPPLTKSFTGELDTITFRNVANATSGNQVVFKSVDLTYETIVTSPLDYISQSGTLEKSSYYIGETFSPTGLTFTAHYVNEETEDITSLVTFSPTPLTEGTTTVVASFTKNDITRTLDIPVTVTEAPTLLSLSINGTLVKSTYTVGDTFDPTGLIIKAIMSDMNEIDVTSSVTYSHSVLALGVTSVTASYTYQGVTKTANITGIIVNDIVRTLMISEIYAGGSNSGAVLTHDFVEIYNISNETINLSGYHLWFASNNGHHEAPDAHVVLSGKIISKGYHLVKLAGGSVGSPLPAEDSLGIRNIGANVRVALTSTATMPVGTTTGDFVDYVGTGTAIYYEGAVATAPTNTQSVSRKMVSGVMQDTNNNSADFELTTPTPTNTSTSFATKMMESDTPEQCITLYPIMKSIYADLSSNQQDYFKTSSVTVVANARNRYTAWALYHGESIEGTPLGSSSKAIQNNSSDRSFGATLVIGLIGLSSILGYSFVMKKRRVI